jgi:hypothetical protein
LQLIDHSSFYNSLHTLKHLIANLILDEVVQANLKSCIIQVKHVVYIKKSNVLHRDLYRVLYEKSRHKWCDNINFDLRKTGSYDSTGIKCGSRRETAAPSRFQLP